MNDAATLFALFPWKRALLCILALLTPFFFPWQLSVAFIFFSALFVPWLAFVAGILFDLLYYTGGVPYFTLLGLAGSIVAYFVHQFLKTRIMS